MKMLRYCICKPYFSPNKNKIGYVSYAKQIMERLSRTTLVICRKTKKQAKADLEKGYKTFGITVVWVDP